MVDISVSSNWSVRSHDPLPHLDVMRISSRITILSVAAVALGVGGFFYSYFHYPKEWTYKSIETAVKIDEGVGRVEPWDSAIFVLLNRAWERDMDRIYEAGIDLDLVQLDVSKAPLFGYHVRILWKFMGSEQIHYKIGYSNGLWDKVGLPTLTVKEGATDPSRR